MLLSATLFFWTNKQGRSDDFVSDFALPENQPDVYVTTLALTRYDPDGQILMTTKADDLAVYEDSGKSLMTNPDVVLSDNNIETWRIRSKNAVIYNNDDIEFKEQVVVLQLNTEPQTKINTDYMKVTNGGNLILTDKPVLIEKGKQLTKAIGMEVKLDTLSPVIHLLSDVSFFYDPS